MKKLLEARLRQFEIAAKVSTSPAVATLGSQSWLATTSSHLGKSTQLHAEVCRYITQSMIDAKRRGQVLLIASDSAIEPWAERAAELFAVPVVRVRVGNARASHKSIGETACIEVQPCAGCDRDSIVAALADRIDCVFARPKGCIESSLRLRLAHRRDSRVRIAVHPVSVDNSANKVAHGLMRRGAVGWHCLLSDSDSSSERVSNGVDRELPAVVSNDWATADGEWLVHCTRACSGPWPGQSVRQHRDELLLGCGQSANARSRSSLDSLQRITRMRRLVSSALASARSWPVVCFSAVPLATLLGRRSYRSHLHRWDYEPYGLAIRKAAAVAAGIQPVIYGSRSQRDSLSPAMKYRFQASGTTFDWTQEQEWRCSGDIDLDRFDPDDIRIFVRSESDLKHVTTRYHVSIVGDYLSQ